LLCLHVVLEYFGYTSTETCTLIHILPYSRIVAFESNVFLARAKETTFPIRLATFLSALLRC
jgi:hypothetical protein